MAKDLLLRLDRNTPSPPSQIPHPPDMLAGFSLLFLAHRRPLDGSLNETDYHPSSKSPKCAASIQLEEKANANENTRMGAKPGANGNTDIVDGRRDRIAGSEG